MDEASLAVLAIVLPILAALAGWILLWRRNRILYRLHNIHFCGSDLKDKGFWSIDKGERRPLLDAFEVKFTNFGIKHLDEFQFIVYRIEPDFVIHADHANRIPETSFSFEYSERMLKVCVKEVPAFEKFGISFINTNPGFSFVPVGSGKHFVLMSLNDYFYRSTLLVAGLVSAFVVMRFILASAI